MAIAMKTLIKPYVVFDKKKKRLKLELAKITKAMTDMEPAIADAFTEQGIQSINVDGACVHLKRSLFAGAKDGKDKLIEVLKQMEDETWSFLVGDDINANKLSARVRECECDENDLPIIPDELKKVLSVAEVFKIGVRK